MEYLALIVAFLTIPKLVLEIIKLVTELNKPEE